MKIISKITRKGTEDDVYLNSHIKIDGDITETIIELNKDCKIYDILHFNGNILITRYDDNEKYVWTINQKRKYRKYLQVLLEEEYKLVLNRMNRIKKIESL